MAAIDEDAALWTGVCGDKGGVGGDEEGGALAVEGHGAGTVRVWMVRDVTTMQEMGDVTCASL